MTRLGPILLIIIIVFLFMFTFLLLPTQCGNTSYWMHDHCHHMREVGVNCDPDGDNCWYHNHHTPGPYGFFLIIFAFGAVGFCLWWTPEKPMAVKALPVENKYVSRKKRTFDNV